MSVLRKPLQSVPSYIAQSLSLRHVPRLPSNSLLSDAVSIAPSLHTPLFIPSERFTASSSPHHLPIFSALFPNTRYANGINTRRFLEELRNPHVMVTVETTNMETGEFNRREIPLSVFLHLLSLPEDSPVLEGLPGVYLPQLPVRETLPEIANMLAPVTDMFSDVYGIALWMGRDHGPWFLREAKGGKSRFKGSSTPLHTDPNHNIFLQLAGRKRVRLWAPEVGERLVSQLVDQVTKKSWSRVGLKESEMAGPLRERMEEVVWWDGKGSLSKTEGMSWMMEDWWEGYEVTLKRGQGVMIPRGWWHAVRSSDSEWRAGKYDDAEHRKTLSIGVASVNWWFR